MLIPGPIVGKSVPPPSLIHQIDSGPGSIGTLLGIRRFRDEHLPGDIAHSLFFKERSTMIDGAHCRHQLLLIDERNANDALPGIFLAVGVDFEVLRVILHQRGCWVDHQIFVRVRKHSAALWRQDREKLHQGSEGLSLFEGYIVFSDVNEVGGEGSVEMRVVPRPGRTPSVT